MQRFTYDPEKRRQLQNPELILKNIGLSPGMTFMDIGCNDGFFTLPAAEMVGPQGRIYGVDIDDQALDKLEQRAKADKLNNIILKHQTAEYTLICNGCADIIFYGTVLHDFLDPEKVLKNAYEMLKPRGKIVDFDWKKTDLPIGPPLQKKLSPERVSELISEVNLQNPQIEDVSRYFYQITAYK